MSVSPVLLFCPGLFSSAQNPPFFALPDPVLILLLSDHHVGLLNMADSRENDLNVLPEDDIVVPDLMDVDFHDANWVSRETKGLSVPHSSSKRLYRERNKRLEI